MKELNKKHVTISMSNGTVLEGFVDETNDEFLYLIEINNNKVVVRISDISFARIGQENVQPAKTLNQDYSVPMNQDHDNYTCQLDFVRKQK